ncbi:MAG: hypothetical protein ACM3PE_02285 [Deltaproteobacteria bacterium]
MYWRRDFERREGADDLEEERRIWPQSPAIYFNYLSMHGYIPSTWTGRPILTTFTSSLSWA